ncbi:MAG: HTTM domain-containing protein [Planctomycetaceae bacterium]|nr:HTTM domain-containing protein [Planctomycetaceae bacterium]
MKTAPQESSAFSGLREFFFAEETPFGMAMMRIMLPLVASIPMFKRFPRVRELYTTDGATVQLFEMFGNGEVLHVLSPAVAIPLYGIMLLCLVSAIIGFRTRLSLLIGGSLYAYFNLLDSVGTMTKYSVISTHLFLLLAVSNCGAIWSVDAWLARRSGKETGPLPPKFPVWPARLVQMLFSALYFGASITKIKTEAFFTGEQMRYWMLSNWNYENPVGEVMAMWSPILLVGAYMAVIWEVVFPFLVWQRQTRWFVLLMGVTFHILTLITLGLYIFPSVCLSGYFGFVTEADFLRFRKFFVFRILGPVLKFPQKAGAFVLDRVPPLAPAAITWCCLIAVAAITSTEVELRLDLYGRRTPEGGYALKPMDRTVALTMIRNEQRVREHDKFFNFEIGTSTVGFQLANRRSEFEFGETMIAQCNLNPPHEDMWVECLLKDEDGRVIEQFGQFVTREMLRANFFYKLGNKLIPGKYSMVLKSSNQEIYSRPFTLRGEAEPQTVLTN